MADMPGFVNPHLHSLPPVRERISGVNSFPVKNLSPMFDI